MTTSNFMTLAEQEDLVSIAIDETNQRIKSTLVDGKIYEYILNQLIYIQSCIRDKSKDRSELHNVNIGALAVREFDGVDESYSVVLQNVFFIVSYMKRGLKVPVLDEQGNIRK